MDLIVRTERLPLPGETRIGGGFVTLQGGKGANQAIAAVRAGGTVSLIGAVGSDSLGDQLETTLLATGIDAERLRRLDGPSGVAMITVDDDGENTIVVAPGANAALTGLTAQDERVITESALLVLQLELPIETVTAGALAAARAGVPVLLNPSPVRDQLPEELLAAVTVVVLNEGEHDRLGGSTSPPSGGLLAAVPHVVTTLGAAGARYRGPAGYLARAEPPTVRAVDTTGAGDAFTGAFAVAWIEGMDPATALAFACAAGALTTTRRGAGAAAPDRTAIERLLGWR